VLGIFVQLSAATPRRFAFELFECAPFLIEACCSFTLLIDGNTVLAAKYCSSLCMMHYQLDAASSKLSYGRLRPFYRLCADRWPAMLHIQ
jgi:hypothetical protein